MFYLRSYLLRYVVYSMYVDVCVCVCVCAMPAYVLIKLMVYECLFSIQDVKKTAANDDNFFVFEETMQQVKREGLLLLLN